MAGRGGNRFTAMVRVDNDLLPRRFRLMRATGPGYCAAMPVQPLAPTPDALARAAETLRSGGLVAFPTETVYGLGADATDDRAVAKIFAAKGRPHFNPLIAHVPDADAAARLVRFDARAERLAARFWPGPLTMVLPRRDDCPVSLLAGAGLSTLAVRVPAHPLALDLLRAAGRPVAAPSANRSGRVSPTTAQHVEADLGDRIDMILDGGACVVGVESTVLDLSGPQARVLRQGGVAQETLEEVLGPLASGGAPGVITAPGMLESHYAPDLPLRLNATAARNNEALLAFGPEEPEGFVETLNLSSSGNLAEAAANVFSYLRRLDRIGLDGIAVMTIPERGLGRAINDRLRRAAAPRGQARSVA